MAALALTTEKSVMVMVMVHVRSWCTTYCYLLRCLGPCVSLLSLERTRGGEMTDAFSKVIAALCIHVGFRM